MSSWFRRIRGVVSIGALWGSLGAATGATLGLIGGTLLPAIPLGWAVANGAAALGLFGLASGGCFAATLSLVDRRRTLPQLSVGKHAAWGGWAGVVYSAILLIAAGPPLDLLVLLPVSAFFGVTAAGLAAGSILVARRSPNQLTSGTKEFLPPPDG